VVVVGGDVVVVVVGADVVGVVVAPEPAGDSVVVVVVVVDDVDVEGSEVEVVPVLPAVELAPGCSLATTIPMSAVAPAAARIEARVRWRTSALARRRDSGELSW
jgi:hypothetical protein